MPQEKSVSTSYPSQSDDLELRRADLAVRLAAEWFELNLDFFQSECPGGYALIDGETRSYVTGNTEEEAEREFRLKFPHINNAVYFRIIQK